MYLVYVCPAHAGVYPVFPSAGLWRRRLPRTRGGLPSCVPPEYESTWFAPHTRGSTARRCSALPDFAVCPAHAGVYRLLVLVAGTNQGLPRTRGGLPRTYPRHAEWARFAPHTRGSTFGRGFIADLAAVCPAHAGVYRRSTLRPGPTSGLPRTRGGLPTALNNAPQVDAFAPHTRGSTHHFWDG